MKYSVQIDSKIYHDRYKYVSPSRWSTYSLAINEVLTINPKKILEIGPGNGIVSDILKKFGFEVKTLDFDRSINPDYIMDISSNSIIKLKDENFDLVLASEVFEHIEFSDFIKSLNALGQITENLIITLPSERINSLFFYFSFKFPFLKFFQFAFKIKRKRTKNIFNGQHYWEIGKIGFSLRKIRKCIAESGWKIEKDFYNCQNSYHYFFILKKQL